MTDLCARCGKTIGALCPCKHRIHRQGNAQTSLSFNHRDKTLWQFKHHAFIPQEKKP